MSIVDPRAATTPRRDMFISELPLKCAAVRRPLVLSHAVCGGVIRLVKLAQSPAGCLRIIRLNLRCCDEKCARCDGSRIADAKSNAEVDEAAAVLVRPAHEMLSGRHPADSD